jgi:hypothetical protein
LVDKFEQNFNRKPDFIARSPGRVNLIGEHIDYCGFGVLPMAVDRDVIMAVATTDDDTKIRIANVNSKYTAREFDFEGVDKVVTIDASSLEWSNYFKCGYKVNRVFCAVYYGSSDVPLTVRLIRVCLSVHVLRSQRVCSSWSMETFQLALVFPPLLPSAVLPPSLSSLPTT